MMLRQLLLRCAGALWFTVLASAPVRAADENVSAPVILILGDSLSAGYGVRVDATWVALLQKRLTDQGYGYKVVNASISGETSGGARTRLPRALQLHKPAVVIIELGANDGLRGLPLKQVRSNFEDMLQQVRAAGARAILIAMRLPVNYGPAYSEQLHGMYAELGKQFSVPVVPGFIESVALDQKLMQDDGLHPNAQAQPKLLDVVWPTVKSALKK
jgi:acyl-CoA thioesterase I